MKAVASQIKTTFAEYVFIFGHVHQRRLADVVCPADSREIERKLRETDFTDSNGKDVRPHAWRDKQ